IVGTLTGNVGTITPRQITVTADPQTKVLGNPDPAFTYQVVNIVKGETLVGTLTRDPGEPQGNYAIKQGTVTDLNNPNYSITYVGNFLTITIPAQNPGDSPSRGTSTNPTPVNTPAT